MSRDQVLELVSGTLMSAMNAAAGASVGGPQRLMGAGCEGSPCWQQRCWRLATAASVETAGAAVPTGYNPNNLPVASCFWTGPFTNVDPRTNQGFPGQEITYWGAKFATPPGAVLILRGKFAHARFQSLTAYVNNGDRDQHGLGLPDPPRQGLDESLHQGPSPRRQAPQLHGHRAGLPAAPAAGAQHPLRPARPELQLLPGHPLPGLRPGQGTRAARAASPCRRLSFVSPTARSSRVRRCATPSTRITPTPHRTCRCPTYESYVNWPGKDPATNPADPNFCFEKFFSLNYALSAYKTPAEHATADYTPVGTFYNNLDARYINGTLQLRLRAGAGVRGKMPKPSRSPMPARRRWAPARCASGTCAC